MFRVSPSVGCKPKSVGLETDDDISRLRGNSSSIDSTAASNDSVIADLVTSSNGSASACVWSIPVIHEEVDVLSLRFTPASGANVSVTDAHPTLLVYPLYTQATGGTLNLQLTLNTVSTSYAHASTHTMSR